MDRVHVGTMGWSYGFWVGSFYPANLKSTQFLTEYSKHFDTVEVNNTFYKIPSKDVLSKWSEQTPPRFFFSAKFPQVITHKKMLKDCELELELFIERISALQDKLGPLLLQFPPAFGPEKLALLKDFLPRLPKKYRFAIEIRNDRALDEKLYSVLRENGIALALVISPFMPQSEQFTTDFTYIRWEGDRSKVNGMLGKVEVDRTQEIGKWAERIIGILDKTSQVFGYFSKYYSGHPPTDARKLNEYLALTS